MLASVFLSWGQALLFTSVSGYLLPINPIHQPFSNLISATNIITERGYIFGSKKHSQKKKSFRKFRRRKTNNIQMGKKNETLFFS